MSTNYHTPWQDGVSQYKAVDMNAPLASLDEQIATNTSNINNLNLVYSSGPYDIGGTLDGKPGTSQVLLRYPFPRSTQFIIDMVKSQMVSGVAANAQTVFSIKKNNVEFATATFAAASNTATFTCATTVTFNVGDILTLVAPGSQDANLEDLGWVLAAVRLGSATTTTTTTTTTTSSSTTTTSSSTTTTTTV